MRLRTDGQNGADEHERSLDPVRILLVDDDESWARVTARLLEENRRAFSVETAHSFAAGRERFHGLDTDCVVCDYQLGDGTGLDFLETVRDVDPDLPFLLVTGRGSESVASDAIGRRVTDYIRKDHDDEAAELLSTRVASAVRTYRTERALERERRSKAAVLEILTATAARGELLGEFCSQLVENRGYHTAWIGTAAEGERLTPQAVVGEEAYVSAALGGEHGTEDAEPAVRALVEGTAISETAIEASTEDGEDAGDWRSIASEHGLAAAVAIPIRHDGVRFGVLAVYATEPGVVDDREREALGEYAETIGYALRTAEWKRSLLADESVSIDVTVRDSDAPLLELAEHLDRTVRLEVPSAIERNDGDTLYLLRVEGADSGGLRGAIDDIDGIGLLDLDESVSPLRCELLADGPTPERILADHGARFEGTVVADRAATISVTVPDDRTVSTVASGLEDAYDEADVSTIWTGQRDRETEDPGDPLSALTDRQREILRYAFHDGYYERPRGTSATELAERFDIARATLTQHLRAAERKILGQSVRE